MLLDESYSNLAKAVEHIPPKVECCTSNWQSRGSANDKIEGFYIELIFCSLCSVQDLLGKSRIKPYVTWAWKSGMVPLQTLDWQKPGASDLLGVWTTVLCWLAVKRVAFPLDFCWQPNLTSSFSSLGQPTRPGTKLKLTCGSAIQSRKVKPDEKGLKSEDCSTLPLDNENDDAAMLASGSLHTVSPLAKLEISPVVIEWSLWCTIVLFSYWKKAES